MENEILKTTALVYFQDALQKQAYESCKELIELAKKFGAQQDEIKQIIAAQIKGEKAVKSNEANRIKGSLRLIKGEK